MALWTLLSVVLTCWSAVLMLVWLLCRAARIADEEEQVAQRLAVEPLSALLEPR